MKFFKIFDKPYFKIPIGVLIIIFSLLYFMRFVKVLPVFLKVGIVAVEYLVVYMVVYYLFDFKNRKIKK